MASRVNDKRPYSALLVLFVVIGMVMVMGSGPSRPETLVVAHVFPFVHSREKGTQAP